MASNWQQLSLAISSRVIPHQGGWGRGVGSERNNVNHPTRRKTAFYLFYATSFIPLVCSHIFLSAEVFVPDPFSKLCSFSSLCSHQSNTENRKYSLHIKYGSACTKSQNTEIKGIGKFNEVDMQTIDQSECWNDVCLWIWMRYCKWKFQLTADLGFFLWWCIKVFN